MEQAPEPLVSIVIPVHNESENIEPLVDAIQQVQQTISPPCQWEIIFVDDSTDDTWERIRSLSPRGVSGLRMSRRFGHQAALEAGLERARGHAVISMDGDLQHPPELIIDMIEGWREGYDVIMTKRLSNERAGFIKHMTSKVFYFVFNRLADTYVEPGTSDFRLLSRQALVILNALPERQKFYRGLVPWMGLPTKELTFHAAPRLHGVPAFSMRRLLALALTGMTSSSTAPLLWSLYLGFLLSVIGGVGTVVLGGLQLIGVGAVSGLATLTAFMVLNTGIMLSAIGVLSLFVSSLHKEILRRPAYIVAEESAALETQS